MSEATARMLDIGPGLALAAFVAVGVLTQAVLAVAAISWLGPG